MTRTTMKRSGARFAFALAEQGINLLMRAFQGTDAQRQQHDRRLGYDAPELCP